MSNSLLIPDTCLVVLAKLRRLMDLDQLIEFLRLWTRVAKHANSILFCLQKNSFLIPDLDFLLNPPTKAQRKATLKVFQTSKKLKYIDDPLVVKEACITALRDHWFIAYSKLTLETKAWIKKAADGEKKLVEKQDKVCEKTRAKNQTIDIRRLVLSNSQTMEIEAFKEILSDPLTRSEPQDAESSYAHTGITLSPSNKPNQRYSPNSSNNPIDVLMSARLSINQKKKAT